uniref:Nucleotide exchange factor Fes1 domain-containing protein n=2 Tax=Guillardia theta TaxID=55529 RepID=A0A7S4H8S7_GUITH
MARAKLFVRTTVVFLFFVLTSAQLVLEDVPVEQEDKRAQGAGQAADPMTRMLQWGVDHTDKETLAERARAIREGRAQPTKIDREVMDALFGTKVKFLQKVVERLLSSVRRDEAGELVEVLEELEGEITDIDNANDLDKVGGLQPVLELLSHREREVKTAALWVVGTAAQSNPVLQELLAGRHIMAKLLAPMEEAGAAKEVQELDPKLLAKSLYAVSTFVRGCRSCLEQFVEGGGAGYINSLLALLSRNSPEVPQAWLSPARKTVALVGDLVQEENAPVNPLSPTPPPPSSRLTSSACLLLVLCILYPSFDFVFFSSSLLPSVQLHFFLPFPHRPPQPPPFSVPSLLSPATSPSLTSAQAATSALLTKFTEAAPSGGRRSACGEIVSLLGGGDRELQEKSLQTLIAVLRARPSALGKTASFQPAPCADQDGRGHGGGRGEE